MAEANDETTRRFADLRRRLAEAAQSKGAVSAEQARQVLARRAQLLARRTSTQASGPQQELLCFLLGSERYGIDARYVRQVIKCGHLARVPHAPSYCLGVSNLRGELLPVFDVRGLLGVAASAPAEGSRVLVLGTERTEIGLLVDAVEQIGMLDTRAILDAVHARSESRGPAGAWVSGVTRDALIVLDGAALLSDPRLFLQGDADGMPQERSQA